MQTCPKCHYTRTAHDICPEWQCPNCGVAYCKVGQDNLSYQPHERINYTNSRHVHRSKSQHWGIISGLLFVLLLLTFIGLGHYWKKHRGQQSAKSLSIETPQSELSKATISQEPIQIMLEEPLSNFEQNGYSLKPLASFELEAKVLSKENYWFGREAELSKTDLALGWGIMATDELLNKVEVTQHNRWYFWNVSHDFTDELGREISTHSSNMHIIPGNSEVERQLDDIEKGQIVYIKGYLIQANAQDGWHWQSSLSREDTGNGACELVWAEKLQTRSTD